MAGGRTWTQEEDALVRDYFPKYGPSWKGWIKLLPGRSMWAICARRKVLGVPGVRESGNYRPKDISLSSKRPKFEPGDRPRTETPMHGPLQVCVPPQTGDWNAQQIGWLVEAIGLMGDTGHTLGECVAMIGALVKAYKEETA